MRLVVTWPGGFLTKTLNTDGARKLSMAKVHVGTALPCILIGKLALRQRHFFL